MPMQEKTNFLCFKIKTSFLKGHISKTVYFYTIISSTKFVPHTFMLFFVQGQLTIYA